jgi:hypothetical protein
MSSGGSGKAKAAAPPPAAPAAAVPAAADADAAEKAAHKRKFGPLYEALEAYNFRQVLKLSEKRELASLPLTKVRATLEGARTGPLVRSLCVYGAHAGPCAFVKSFSQPRCHYPSLRSQALRARAMMGLGARDEALSLAHEIAVSAPAPRLGRLPYPAVSPLVAQRVVPRLTHDPCMHLPLTAPLHTTHFATSRTAAARQAHG